MPSLHLSEHQHDSQQSPLPQQTEVVAVGHGAGAAGMEDMAGKQGLQGMKGMQGMAGAVVGVGAAHGKGRHTAHGVGRHDVTHDGGEHDKLLRGISMSAKSVKGRNGVGIGVGGRNGMHGAGCGNGVDSLAVMRELQCELKKRRDSKGDVAEDEEVRGWGRAGIVLFCLIYY